MLPDTPLLRYLICAWLILLPLITHAQCWPLSEKLLPTASPNTTEGFGSSLDHEGDIAVVGAPSSDELHSYSGAVYVFQFSGNTWTKIASLRASDHHENQGFGREVLIHGDFIFVADPSWKSGQMKSGGIYVFKKPATGWQDMEETSVLTPSHPYRYQFGYSMAAYEDKLLIGAPYTDTGNGANSGAAFLFELWGEDWRQIATFKASHPGSSSFGVNVAIAEDLAVVVASEETIGNSTDVGAAYVFEKDPGAQWSTGFPIAQLTESSGNQSINNLGAGLAIDEARSTIFVTQIIYTPTQGFRSIQAYKKPVTGWTNMTQTSAYKSINKSNVYGQTLRFEEPYLYSAGGKFVDIFSPDVNDNWSLDSPVGTLSKPDLFAQQQFGTDVSVSHGSVLVSAPALVSIDRDEPIRPSPPAILEFVLPPTQWLPGENFPERSFTYMPLTASDYYYGGDIDIDGDVAVVGSPNDNIDGARAGAVYLYQLSDYTWNKIATLTPSDGEPYDNFGKSVAISKDVVAVSSYNKHYRDETGKIIDFNLGAIYIFKKSASGWSDTNESYKIIRSEGKVDYTNDDDDDDYLGSAIDLDYPYLVASRFEQNSVPNSGAVLVFNLTNDEAVLEATLTPSTQGHGSNFGESLCIRGNTIAAGHGIVSFWFQNPNQVYMYEKDAGSKWTTTTESAILMPSDNGANGYLPGFTFGHSLDMTEDGSTIIIGAPGWYDGIVFETQDYFKGAAYIFEKPADGWKGLLNEQARLTIPNQQAYANMGLAVHIEERYAVVGSPRNYFYTNGSQNPGLGRAYFYHKPEDGWEYKLPDKIIEGVAGEAISDYFGTSAEGVYGYLMIGAMGDHNHNSVNAGAVYVFTEYPFINPAPNPVCENAAAIPLTAVPPGGNWEGNGIANPADGIFDPALAGAGIHTLRYKVDDCDATNTITIEVIPIPKPILLTLRDSLYFCGNASVNVKVPNLEGIQYEWFFSRDGQSFSPIVSGGLIMEATKQGLYRVNASNACATASDTVWVGDIHPDGGPDFNACIATEKYSLTGSPTGSWSGKGVSASGLFDPAAAGKGTHELFFSVIPEPGCVYRDTVVIAVSNMPAISIQPAGLESFCYTGSTTLRVTALPQTDYIWSFEISQDDFSVIQQGGTETTATSAGLYQVVADDGICTQQVRYRLTPPPFTPTITPASEEISFCADERVLITAPAIDDAQYTWFTYNNDSPEIESESSDTFSQLLDKSGKFKLRIESHGCIFDSKDITAIKIPGDSVFIPNVFTPNGDQYNEHFDIQTTGVDAYSISVFNRYGKEVWAGNAGSPPWNAEHVTAGVYFWRIEYGSICGKRKEKKGWVHVMK